jgi:hypothetical protein
MLSLGKKPPICFVHPISWKGNSSASIKINITSPFDGHSGVAVTLWPMMTTIYMEAIAVQTVMQ